jgi:hypothetical protein
MIRRPHRGWSARIAVLFALAWAPPAPAAEIKITGGVACRGGAAVTGVWVAYERGGGVWATRAGTTAPWLHRYTATIDVPNRIRLDVGCGGSERSWGSNNHTSFLNVTRAGNFSASCKEAAGPPARRCGWWGETILVGAPFDGIVNRFKYADVAPGAHPIYGNRAWSDWSTDFYAAARTAVRPRIYTPSAGYQLRIDRVVPGCAGKVVAVGVYRGAAKLGEVSYAHLDAVPAFTPGQVITTGTGLGKLKLWPRCRSWQVSGASGVHTHIEVGSLKPGTACFMPRVNTRPVASTRLIGIINPGKPASCA